MTLFFAALVDGFKYCYVLLTIQLKFSYNSLYNFIIKDLKTNNGMVIKISYLKFTKVYYHL